LSVLTKNSQTISKRVSCKLLSINRSGIYYQPVKPDNNDIKKQIYEIWSSRNEKGYRVITKEMREKFNNIVNHKKVIKLMRELKIKGIMPKANLSKNKTSCCKHPYLLANMAITKSNQAWCTDITYIKLPTGTVYLTVMLDIYSRAILDYEISNTLDKSFCVELLQRCLKKYATPAIINTDQGVQYTSHAWISTLQQYNIGISMDGKGRWADNIWVERFWRTIKYESCFMFGADNLADLKRQIKNYINYYNNSRLHSAIGYKTPMAQYHQGLDDFAVSNDCNSSLYCLVDDYTQKIERYKQIYRKVA
jgi:putative transposase